jgi:hypothetical protein
MKPEDQKLLDDTVKQVDTLASSMKNLSDLHDQFFRINQIDKSEFQNPISLLNGGFFRNGVSIGGGAVGRVGGSAITTMATATTTKIPFNTKTFADGITWDASNHRFVVTFSGKYLITAQINWYNNNAGGGNYYVILYKNGVQNSYGMFLGGAINFQQSNSISDILDLVEGDYIEVFGTQGSGAVAGVYNDTNQTFLAITRV